MPKYIISVREVWVQPIEVEADSVAEAKARVWSFGHGTGIVLEDRFEYSHCLEPDLWTVEEVKEAV